MSAFSVSEPFPTFHDRDGQPLDGGFLYFGTAGLPAGANQVPVYVDAALTIPAAQPVRTLNGFPQYQGAACRLYVNADDFSVAVHQSDNTLVFSSLNATVRIPLASTTGSISADRVEYTEGSAGSIARTLTGKLQESVSVFDFMTPAQIADVQAGTLLYDVDFAIYNALAASDDVFFPEGAYRVTNDGTATSGAIQIANGTAGKTLRGAGRGNTVIHNYGAGPCITSVGNPIIANVSVHISDMTIQGQAGTGQGIFCDYTSQSAFERLEFLQCSDGIKIQRGAHNVLTDIWSRSNTFDGALIGQEAYFTTITGGTFEANGRHGLSVTADGAAPAQAPNDVTITGASFRSNVQHNVNVADGANTVRLFGCVLLTTPTDATARHFSVDGGAGTSNECLAYGCTFVGQNSSSSVVGVYGNACEDLSLDGCTIDCTGSDAYALTATAVRTRIVNCSQIVGAKIDASNATTQLLPDGGVYALRRSSSYTGATAFDFASGYGRFDTTLLADAFRFYALPLVTIFPVIDNTSILRLESSRLWVNSNTGNLQISGSDPINSGDGLPIGPGVSSHTFATLPASRPVGTMARCTDLSVAPAFGAVAAGGGVFAGFVIWNGANWTVCGV
jgi:hypothetical protein